VEEEFLRQTLAVKAMGDLLEAATVAEVMHRQTAIQLGAGPDSLRPLYHHVAFSVAALDARVNAHGAACADPLLLRHLGSQLDVWMLDGLRQRMGAGGPLDVVPRPRPEGPAVRPVPLHLHLTLHGLQSDAFTGFAAACAESGATYSVEVNVMEAAADPDGFAELRDRLDRAGTGLVIGGVNHLTLQIARPWKLRPRLMKLDWSPRLPELDRASAHRLDAVLADIGPVSVILARAETETAMHWGLARGIRKFQGRHVDAMLGASRLMACPHAASCTLRQCIERAGAIGPAGRAGCLNTDLLDAAVPARLSAAVPSDAGAARAPVPVA